MQRFSQSYSGIVNGKYVGRYGPLSDGFEPVPQRKRARHSTGQSSITPPKQFSTNDSERQDTDRIKTLSTDEKLNYIIDKLSQNDILKVRVDNIEAQVYVNCATHEVLDERVRLLEYKSIDLEVRNRECNIIISGVPEKVDENTSDVVESILQKHLDLDTPVHLLQAYRLGRIIRPRAPHLPAVSKPQHRTILARFAYAYEVELLLSSAYKLKGTKIGLSRDFPREISDARKALWPEYKSQKQQFGSKDVRIRFPAALVVKNRVIKDMFPDWHSVLRGSRDSDPQRRISAVLQARSETARLILASQAELANQGRPAPELVEALDLENEIMSQASREASSRENTDVEVSDEDTANPVIHTDTLLQSPLNPNNQPATPAEPTLKPSSGRAPATSVVKTRQQFSQMGPGRMLFASHPSGKKPAPAAPVRLSKLEPSEKRSRSASRSRQVDDNPGNPALGNQPDVPLRD